MNARRAILAVSIWLCALAGVLVLSTTPALAARGHVFGASFGKEVNETKVKEREAGKSVSEAEEDVCTAASEDTCQAATPGSGDDQFSDSGSEGFQGPTAVAVNESSGDVYVVDTENGRVERFSSSGAYLGEFNGTGSYEVEGKTETGPVAPNGQLVQPHAIAVDNSTNPADPSKGDVYVTDNDLAGGKVTIDKFSATGEYIGQITGTPKQEFSRLEGVAVDLNGNLWVDYDFFSFGNGDSGASFNDAVANECTSEIESSQPAFSGQKQFNWGLAVNAEDNLFIPRSAYSEGMEEASSTGELLSEQFGGTEISGEWVAVESSSGDPYLSSATTVDRLGVHEELIEKFGAGHLVNATGLAVNATSSTVYVADSSEELVDIFPLEPPGRPTIENESVSEVTSDSASFAGEINPRSESSERDTEYHFEYGACASPSECAASAYEVSAPVPDALLSADYEVHSVGGVHPQDLLARTTYHFRIVATNAHGSTDGEEEVFTTQTAGGPLVLPDGRSWELVSPVDKHSALIDPIGEAGLAQASVNGGAMTYVASSPTESEPSAYAQKVQVLSTRGTDGGWSSVDIGLSHSTPVGVLVGQGYESRFFSEDLGSGVTESFGLFSPPEGERVNARGEAERFQDASPEATERTPYLRHNLTCETEASACYTPLVTGAPECSDVPEGTVFGGTGHVKGEVEFVGATPDASDVVLSSTLALTSTAAPDGGLYEWTAGMPCQERLQLVSVLPKGEGGKAAPGYKFGRDGSARNAISDDGSRIFFSDGDGLYMRDTATGESIRLDLTEAGAGGTAPANFQTASTDGSRTFFTDAERLTSGASKEGEDLYECEGVEVEEAGQQKLKCDLRDLTPEPASGQPGAGESAEVQGVLGASEDGSYVYFVANGVLAQGASPGDCGGSNHGEETCNLYVAHESAGAWSTSFIATLSGGDSPDWAELTQMTARVSPDGEWLAFMSERSLTGYDNRDAVSGKPDEEVYLYNAVSAKLVCASCDPTGARPDGVEYSHIAEPGLVGGDGGWEQDQWLAANIPGWTPYVSGEALYQSRYLSDSGRLFFNSSDALVPQDINGNEDVYEYEPPGVGSCTSSAETFSERSGGCVGLISSGVAHGESAFLDASESGSEVFFLTTEKLVPQDTDTALDVYDAHECTASSPCAAVPASAPPECTSASSCRAAPSLQPAIYGAPSSATFTGAGNAISSSKPPVKKKALTRAQKLAKALKACAGRKQKKRRLACERKARKRYAPAKKAKAKAKTKRGGR